MIAVDTNILVYAHCEESPFHKKTLACITDLSEGRASWAIPWPCIHEFFSIATHPRIYDPPSPIVNIRLDARIAALFCIQNGVTELLTADRDFGRFHELKTRNPLIS